MGFASGTRYAPGTPGSDSLFWALRTHFPRETRDFVKEIRRRGYARVFGTSGGTRISAPSESI